MGTADRDYWREPDPTGPRLNFQLPWVTRVLFFTLIGCFIAQALNEAYGKPQALYSLMLTQDCLRTGRVWQLITFQFLHQGLFHLLSNLLVLWMLAPAVENLLGRTRFALAYFGSGIAGGLLQAVLLLSFPAHFGPALGASAGLEGIFAIFVLLHRDAVFNFMFVLPIRAMTLYYGAAAISIFFTLVPSRLGGSVAHAAHLGGLAFGTLWVRQGWHHDFQPLPGTGLFDRLKSLFQRRPATSKSRRPAPVLDSSRWQATVEARPSPSNGRRGDLAAEVDIILDKIGQHGMQSLTQTERQKLEDYHRRIKGK